MGASASTQSSSAIDDKALIFTGSISKGALFSINSAVCRQIKFKETTLIQYTKNSEQALHDKLRKSATLKAVLTNEFTDEKLIERAVWSKFSCFIFILSQTLKSPFHCAGINFNCFTEDVIPISCF